VQMSAITGAVKAVAPDADARARNDGVRALHVSRSSGARHPSRAPEHQRAARRSNTQEPQEAAEADGFYARRWRAGRRKIHFRWQGRAAGLAPVNFRAEPGRHVHGE